LLFLFALLVVVRGFVASLSIITSFTIAHSITLAVATLHLVQIPSRIVEPLIAASIVFVGIENLMRGDIPSARRMMAFGFGLIHGFGFASALHEAGIGSGAGGSFSSTEGVLTGDGLGTLACCGCASLRVCTRSQMPPPSSANNNVAAIASNGK